MSSNYISIDHINKSYISGKKKVEALSDICLNIGKGELFGLIGPDGAGKTTLFRILTTLLLADSGNATVAGLDVIKDYKKIRHIIGYMPGRFSLYQDLSVEENLSFFATLFNTSIKESYDFIYDIYKFIEPFKNRRAGALSGGMKQKLALCCALIHKPKVLFLDEPTTGVDPVSRKEFWEILHRFKNDGISIMASTPYMDEAKQCDRISLILSGKIMACDKPEEINKHFVHDLFALKSSNMPKLLIDVRTHKYCEACYAFGEYLHLSLIKGYSLQDLQAFLIGLGHIDIEITSLKPTIEDSFMYLTRIGENKDE